MPLKKPENGIFGVLEQHFRSFSAKNLIQIMVIAPFPPDAAFGTKPHKQRSRKAERTAVVFSNGALLKSAFTFRRCIHGKNEVHRFFGVGQICIESDGRSDYGNVLRLCRELRRRLHRFFGLDFMRYLGHWFSSIVDIRRTSRRFYRAVFQHE